jgi:hypothetical protein
MELAFLALGVVYLIVVVLVIFPDNESARKGLSASTRTAVGIGMSLWAAKALKFYQTPSGTKMKMYGKTIGKLPFGM